MEPTTQNGPGAASQGHAVHVQWRMNVAQQVAGAYGEAPRLAAMTAAGSVGAGWADRWSDLELDCYWWEAPTNADRLAPIDRVGGVLTTLWDYDETDFEWSEDYRLGPIDVTVSNFTVGTIDAFIAAVVTNADTDPVKHMRLAALQRCRPLRGAELIGAWNQRALAYPDRLVAAMVERALSPQVLVGWAAREALIDRGDEAALHALLSRAELGVLAASLALSRTYQPHRIPKWQRNIIGELEVLPADLLSRLGALWGDDCVGAIAEAERLLAETLALAERHSTAELSDFRETLAASRLPIEPPQTT